MQPAEDFDAEQREHPRWALTADRPFPGLRPFAFPDHPFFFGREDQTYSIYRLLDRSRFIAVVGASGSGKSSLVRAGLLPLLAKETMEKGGRKWDWYELRPGDSPIDSLVTALSGEQPEVEQGELARTVYEAGKERLLYAIRRSSFGLVDALAQLEFPKDRSVVLVVDQFEELFRFSAAEKTTGRNPVDEMRRRDESAHFVQLLLEASRDSKVAIHVLITMRSDFIGECARYHGLPEVVSASQFLVPALTRDQREDIIQCPIERANAIIDPELVERLINDSNDEFDLPVLQHCLMRLWEETGKAEAGPTNAGPAGKVDGTVPDRPRHLKLELYNTVGGIARALSRHAEEILAGLADCDIAVEQTFRALSEVDKNGRATRRALTLERIREETGVPRQQLERVIDRFRADDCSFLVPPTSSIPKLAPSTRIDVGHEALLRRWERISSEPSAGIESKRRVPHEGWLWQEEADGRTYQALLAWIESTDPETRATLPLDAVESRWQWWTSRHRTAAWAERYGGGFDRVQQLFKDSLKALDDERVRQQAAEARERDRILQEARVERETLERRRAQVEADLLRTKARSTRIIALLLAGLVLVSLALLYISQTQRGEALKQSADAQAARDDAERQRADADAARTEADNQRAAAENEKAEANRLRAEAETGRTRAVKQRAAALVLQSRFFASQSRREIARGYTRFGVLLAQEAFKPLERSGLPASDWPQDAEMALHMAMTAILPGKLLKQIPQQISRSVLAPGAKLLATISPDDRVQIWDREGMPVGEVRHTGHIASVMFSEDGTQLVTASFDDTAKIWKASDRTTTTLQHNSDVNFAAFSADGRYIVTASDNNGYIWSASGKQLATLRHSDLTHAAFAPGGKRVATSDGANSIVWDMEGKKLFQLSPPAGGVKRTIFSPDGKSILTISERTPRIWNSAGKEQRPLTGHQDVVTDATFGPDGSRLVTVSRDQTAQIWDLNKLEVIATLRHEGSVSSARFSRDGNQILTIGGDGTVRLWSSNGSKLASLQLQANASSATFEPDGLGIFAVAGNEFRLWHPAMRGMRTLIHPDIVNFAAFDRSGERVLTLANGIAGVWTLATDTFVKIGEPTIRRASFLGQGNVVLVRSLSGNAQLWSSEGRKLQALPIAERGGLDSRFLQLFRRVDPELLADLLSEEVSPSNDGQFFLTKGRGSTTLWDSQARKLTEMPGNARFNNDNTRIVTQTSDGAAVLWNIAGEKIAQLSQGGARRDAVKPLGPEAAPDAAASLKGTSPTLKTVEFSLDGNKVALAYADGQVQIWSKEGVKLTEFQTGGTISSALVNPDGTQVAIVRLGKRIELWSASGERIAAVDQDTSSTILPQYSPDGTRLLVVSGDKATLWDNTGKVIRILPHDAPVQGAVFSASGHRILTYSSNGSIQVWSESGEKLAEIALEGRISSVSFNADATKVLATGADAVARIFDLHSSVEMRQRAQQLELEPLSPSERLRLLVLDSPAQVE